MGNIKFFDYNNWGALNLEGSGSETGWPYTNTQERWKTKAVRLSGVTGVYIRSTGGVAIPAGGFFVFGHNVTATGTVTVKGSDDNWLSTPFSQVMTRGENIFVYIPPAQVTYDDYGIYIDDASNTDGYIELGVIWLGAYWEPQGGYSERNIDIKIDPTVKLTSTGGAISILERKKFKTWLLPFDCIYDKPRYDLLIDRVGTSKPLVILKQPKAHHGLDFPDPEINSHYVNISSHNETVLIGDKYRATLDLTEERG